jgi:hypothetical protein
MRLTLRTLLAYMDGLLDAKDSQEIGKKIEDSQFAKDLFHKIRDVMRRLRLGAPSLSERAANLDCNTVAEYLDNALPGDRVPDFEEVSLKSEMHLAEVASCHQILTMVLGEPVEIAPESRQRMYQLPTVAGRVDEERIAAAEAATMLSGEGNGAPPTDSHVKVRPRPIVPEYLRDPPKKPRLLLAAAIMLIVGAVVGLLWMTLDPHAKQRLQAVFRGKAADDDDHGVKKPLKPSDGGLPTGQGSAASGSGAAAGSGLLGFGKDSGNSLTATSSGAESAVPTVPTSAGNGPGALTSGTVTVAGTASAAGSVPSVAGPGVKPQVPGLLPGAATGGTAGGSATPRPTEIAANVPTPGSKPMILPPGTGLNARPRGEDKLKVGKFISGAQDVLLKSEANEGGWRRVGPEEFIAAHQPLLALPSYRPRLAVLNVEATLELINGTRVELLPENAQGPPGVDIDFGRVVIKPLAQNGARLRVVVGSHSGTLTLTNVDSIAGLEVTRVHDPGTDPEKVFSHALTKLYVARGGAIWEEGKDKTPVQLSAPAELMLDGTAADSPSAIKPGLSSEYPVPKWITANTVNESDQRAALSVSQALSPQRGASMGLMELTDDRRIEIRWLSARCLDYLGQFDPMTAALNDTHFQREWPDYVDELKEAIARGPETATSIRLSLEKQPYGNESAALYRMLWGYTDKQLEDGEDARLVKFLDHELMVYRVLAFWNLQDITHATHGYRPEANAAKRLPLVQQWRKQQQLGRIRHNLQELKLKAGPGNTPDKGRLPAPPKPLNDVQPGVNPASALEPIPPGPPPAAPRPNRADRLGDGRDDRLPVAIPEPDPEDKRPRIVVPEP